MQKKKSFLEKNYLKLFPKKAKRIKKAVKRGIMEYEETFKRLAQT